jgi:hypothetical protein
MILEMAARGDGAPVTEPLRRLMGDWDRSGQTIQVVPLQPVGNRPQVLAVRIVDDVNLDPDQIPVSAAFDIRDDLVLGPRRPRFLGIAKLQDISVRVLGNLGHIPVFHGILLFRKSYKSIMSHPGTGDRHPKGRLRKHQHPGLPGTAGVPAGLLISFFFF